MIQGDKYRPLVLVAVAAARLSGGNQRPSADRAHLIGGDNGAAASFREAAAPSASAPTEAERAAGRAISAHARARNWRAAVQVEPRPMHALH